MSDTAQIVKMISDDFYGGKLDLSSRGIASYDDPWSQMPAEKLVKEMRYCGKSERTVRLFLTFVSAMDRMREASSLWEAAAVLFRSRPELFEPSEAIKIPLDRLESLLRKSRVSKYHAQDSKAWHVISGSLALEDSPVRRVIDSGFGGRRGIAKVAEKQGRDGSLQVPASSRSENRADVGSDNGRPGRC